MAILKVKKRKKKEAVERRKPSSSKQTGILQIIFARRWYLRVTTIHIDAALFPHVSRMVFTLQFFVYTRSRIFSPYYIRYCGFFSFFFLLLSYSNERPTHEIPTGAELTTNPTARKEKSQKKKKKKRKTSCHRRLGEIRIVVAIVAEL